MKKLIYGFIVASGFIFSLGQVGRIDLGRGVVINLLDLVVIIGVFVAMHQYKKIKDIINPSLRWLAFFAMVSFISLLLHSGVYGQSAFFTASLYLVRLIAYWVIFYVILLSSDWKIFIRKVALASGITIVILGYLQYLLYPSLRNLFYLGWDEHLFRMFSTFLDPNFAGAFFAIFIFFVSGFFVAARRNALKAFYGSILIATLIALYFTYSRTGILMLVAGMIAFFAIYGKKKLSVLVFLIIAVGFFLFANKQIEGLNPLRMASAMARLETVQNGIHIFTQNSLIGVGFNAYRYEQIHQGIRPGEVSWVSHADAGVDNSYVLLLATSGVIGAALYSIFFIKVLRVTFLNLSQSERAVVVSTTVSFLVGGLFINLLFYPPVLLFMIIIWGTTQRKQL